jgi:hypothetical protein
MPRSTLYRMRDPTAPFTLDGLLAAAAEAGLKLTGERLHGWRKAGLIPRPPQLDLGRKGGRPAVYPGVTLAQVLMIDELLKRSRNVDVARWQLFLEGFPIPMEPLQAQLRREGTALIEMREAAQQAWETDDDFKAQAYLDDLMRSARSRDNARLFGEIRRVVGRKRLPLSLQLIAQLRTGTVPGTDDEVRDLLWRAFPIEELTGKAPERILSAIADFMDPDPVQVAVRDADEQTLLRARDEFQQVAAVIGRVSKVVPGLGPAIALEMRRNPSWPPPVFFLYWLRHREDPAIRDAISQLSAYLTPRDYLRTHAD